MGTSVRHVSLADGPGGGRLTGRTALITGAAAGIGAASAEMYATEGARLVLVDINNEALVELGDRLTASGSSVLTLAADVTDESAVEAAFALARREFTELQVLFNCAGGSTVHDGGVEDLTRRVWLDTVDLELLSVGHCARWGIPWLRDSGGGSVINMSSFAAFRGTVRIHAYAAAKGAIASVTRAMAGSYARDGIRVNAIAPGVALSDRARRRITEDNVAASLTFDWGDYPFATGEPRDIAAIATFLASPESRMITGQTLMADGGLTAY